MARSPLCRDASAKLRVAAQVIRAANVRVIPRAAVTGPGGFAPGLGYRFLAPHETGCSRNQQCHQCANQATEEWITPVDPRMPSMKGSPYAHLNSSTIRCCKQHGLRIEAGMAKAEMDRSRRDAAAHAAKRSAIQQADEEFERVVRLGHELLPAESQQALWRPLVHAYMRCLVWDSKSDYQHILMRLRELRAATTTHLSSEEKVLLALKVGMDRP